MATFGAGVAAAAWPVLRTVGGLTTVTVTTVTGSTTDYVTGQVVDTVVVATIDAKVSRFRPAEVDGIRITVEDKKALCLASDLPTSPTLRSTVTLQGEVWAQASPPEMVSNDGLWLLHLRRIGDV